MFIRKLGKAFKNLVSLAIVLVLLFVGFIYRETILAYLIHSQSFYQVYLGDKEHKKDNYQEAIEHYRQALELYPKHVKARYNLAGIYIVYEDYESAVEEYRTVLKYDPEYLNARISLAILLSEEMLQFDEAIAEYNKVVNTKCKIINIPFLYDNRAQLQVAKAIAYYNMGLAYRDKSLLYTENSIKYRELLIKAADNYKKSLDIDKHNYDAQYNLALTYHILGMSTEALTGYCKAMVIAPLNYEAHYNFAVLLRQNNRYKEAFEELKDAGSLLSYSGNTFHSQYIYMMLNDVSRMVIAQQGYEPKKLIKRLDEEIEASTIAADEEVTIDQLEESIRRRIKTASICKNYLDRD